MHDDEQLDPVDESALVAEQPLTVATMVGAIAEDGTGPLVLSKEQRKAYLGKLADFELRLGELPDMQAAFVLGVLQDPTDFTKAARNAGYKWPNVEATRLLNKSAVAACIAAGEQLRENRTLITSERTLHELAIVAFSDITNFAINGKGEVVVKQGVPEYATRAISSLKWESDSYTDDEGRLHTKVKTELKLWPKGEALRMLAMYQRLLQGDTPIGINVDNSKHVHVHQHQHNTWQWGDEKLTF